MGYLFLIFALFSGSLKGFCGKKTSGYTNTLNDAILVNTIRAFLCAAFAFIIICAGGNLSTLVPNEETLLISALSGISTAIFVVSWLTSVKKSAYMLVDVFLTLGILVPLIASKYIFGEEIKLTQWFGVIVLLIAVVIMCSYNNSVKIKMTTASFVLLFICGFASGIADFSQKLFIKNQPDGSAVAFNFYTYIFAALVLFISFALTHKKDISTDKINIKKILSYLIIMAICLFLNSYFKTLAASRMNAIILYPLSQGCALILATLMSVILFKEKLTKKEL